MRPDEFGEVTLRLGSDEVLISSSYEFARGIFDQPSSFTLRLGDGKTAATLLAKYPPKTPFAVSINNRPQFAGYTTGFSISGAASEIALNGKCTLNELTKHEVEKDESFNGTSYRQLIEKAIETVGIERPFVGGAARVFTSNGANRGRSTGKGGGETEDATIAAQLAKLGGSRGGPYPVLRTKAGETLMSLLRRHLDNIGVFLWSDTNGDFIVGVPKVTGEPLYRIERKRGNASHVIAEGTSYGEDHDHRYSDVSVYGYSHSRKNAKTQVKGAFVDPEFVTLGYNRPKVLVAHEARSIEHAEHIAQVYLAAGRRAAFKLQYTVSGHVTRSATRNEPVVWAPDTLVSVTDEWFGLDETFYIEKVQYRRGPTTTTTLYLQRPIDMIFGLDDAKL